MSSRQFAFKKSKVPQRIREILNFYIFVFRYFDIVNLAAVKYYRLLMEDVDEVCSNPSQDVQDDEVDLQALSLAFRLSVLDQDWSKYIPVR